MSLDTKALLDEIDKLFAKQNAKWDQWFAARDAKWDQRFSSRKGTLPIQISTEQPAQAPTTTTSPPTAFPDDAATVAPFVAPPEGAVVRREELASRVVPTVTGTAEILDVEPSDEIRNSFINIAPTDEIRSDGCLTLEVIAPTESAAVLPIDAGEQLVQCGPIDTKSVCAELVDRLSFLPDVLRGNIVSRLPVKDAVRTAVLSRRWRPIWRIASPALIDVHILSPGFTPASPSEEDTSANISSARHSPTPPSTIDSSASSDWAIPEHRYITTHNHAYSIRVTIGGVIPVNCGAQFAKLRLPPSAVLVDIIPWPPQVQSEITDDNVRLRPVPWPSFWEYSLDVHWFILVLRVIFYSISQPIVKILTEDITGDCWQNWLELYEHAVQIDGINWKDSTLSGFIVDQYVHSPIKVKHASSITDCRYTRGAKLVTFSKTHTVLSSVQFLLSPELVLLHSRNLVLELSLEHIFDSSSEWFWGTGNSAFYETLVQVVGFNRKEAIAWVQVTYGSTFIVSEACMWNCRWLIAIFLLCPSCIVHCASCKHNKGDWDFVLWIPWKIPWLFSAVVFQLTDLQHADFGKLLMDMAVLKWLFLSGWCEFYVAKVSGGDLLMRYGNYVGTLIQCYAWSVKLHLLWKYTVLLDYSDCEASNISNQWMVVVPLRYFLQFKYYIADYQVASFDDMVPTSLILQSQVLLVDCDPYIISGYKSLDCLIHLVMKQPALYRAKRTRRPYKQIIIQVLYLSFCFTGIWCHTRWFI